MLLYIILAIVLVAMLIAVGVAVANARAHARLEDQMRNSYMQHYYTLLDEVETLEHTLAKLNVARSPAIVVRLLGEMSVEADHAAEDLTALPLDHPLMAETQAFVRTLSDFCAVKASEMVSGGAMSTEDRETLTALETACEHFGERLEAIPPEDIRWQLARDDAFYDDAADRMGMDAAFEHEEAETMYPSMVYDGPFSAALDERTAQGLTGETIDAATALRKAARFLGVETQYLTVGALSEAKIPGFWVTGGDCALYMTEKGGEVLWFMRQDETAASEQPLEEPEAVRIAQTFLEEHGYGAMTVTWVQEAQGRLIVELTPIQHQAVLYPDLVKVEVRLADGMVVAMDATEYCMNHRARSLPEVRVTASQAQEKLAEHLAVTDSRLALIPLDGGGEQLCWEMTCRTEEDAYMIYLSVEDGREVRIYHLVDTEQGMLAV